jgi:single-strand selective monofunctional uracil DNA glycosylase
MFQKRNAGLCYLLSEAFFSGGFWSLFLMELTISDTNYPGGSIWPSMLVDEFLEGLKRLRFGPPVTHVYNPLIYARESYEKYLKRYGSPPKEVVLLGMNPGPWGMAQTGIPFGEITAVRNWLGIEAEVGVPLRVHPKRPVMGFHCPRIEVSGRRLWGWAQEHFERSDVFFERFFVLNYCPLLFIEADGRNRTPDRLKPSEKTPLFAVCDRVLRMTVEQMRPRFVIGVGKFAAERALVALNDLPIRLGRVTHPSPANPQANRNWKALISKELESLGVKL